jgi:hypothetical protein
MRTFHHKRATMLDMSISIRRIGDLYTVAVTPPHGSWATPEPMFRNEVIAHLRDLGCHMTDIGDAFYSVDPNWLATEKNDKQRISGQGVRAVPVHGWRRIWYQRVAANTIVFHVFAWFNCSVPGTRGRLSRLMSPVRRP